jgi:hypothetical protein
MTRRILDKAVFGVIAISLISTVSLSGCSSQPKTAPISHGIAKLDPAYIQKVLDNLKTIAQASKDKQDAEGITETYYFDNPGPDSIGHGDLTWTTVYDPVSKTHLSRYPSNPTYREAGTGPIAVGIALSAVEDYKTSDPAPTEKDGVFTFEAPVGIDQVTIIYTKDGLVTGVLIEDSLTDPSFTNFYEVNFYNIANPIADQILKTKE